MLFVPFSVFAALYFLFERFHSISGWTFYEVALGYSIIHVIFSISECLLRGFDTFSYTVVTGDFDRLLVRPRSTFLQVLGSRFEFTRVGRLAQGIMVFVLAVTHLSIRWTVLKIITLVMMFVAGVFVFAGIFILGATLSFWTIQGIEVVNIFTDGGREMAQYPLNIYKKWVIRFFTFIIPLGCVNYLPLMYLLDRPTGNVVLPVLAPLYGMLFIIPCILIWRWGVKHYRSTGS